MKRLLSILTSIAILSAFSSCKEKTKEIQNQEQFKRSPSNMVYMETGAIFYDYNTSEPMIIDYSTMETALLCNIPNCTHTISNCLVSAFKIEDQLPVMYDNSAYYFLNSSYFIEKDGKNALDLTVKLMKYDFDKMEISKVTEIKGHNVHTGSYLIGSEYYFTTNEGNPKYDEFGNVVSSSNSGGGNLFSINLENNKITDYGKIFDYEALKERYKGASTSTGLTIVGKIKNKLYISVSYHKESVTQAMIEQGNREPFYGETYTFNLDTYEIELVENYMSFYAAEDYVAYIIDNQPSDFTLKIGNVETGEFSDEMPINSLTTITFFEDKAWFDSKCYDIETGILETVSEFENASCIGVYDNHYILTGYDENGQEIFEKVPCEEIDKLFE